jgi:hypothetical protein
MGLLDEMFPMEVEVIEESTEKTENKILKENKEKGILKENKKVEKKDKSDEKKELDYFVVRQKKSFRDTHSQQNFWLENDLKEELENIFKGRQKGFKTEFYNAALRFAVKRYRELQK